MNLCVLTWVRAGLDLRLSGEGDKTPGVIRVVVYKFLVVHKSVRLEENLSEYLHEDILGKKKDILGSPGGSDGKESACNVGYPGSIPGSGRPPGEDSGSPLQYSCLENPADRRLAGCSHEVAESATTERLTAATAGRRSWVSCSVPVAFQCGSTFI